MSVWHALSAEEAAQQLRSDIARGLNDAEAAARLVQHGPNTLAPAQQQSMLMLIARQFRSLIVGLLLAAAGVAFALGEVIEAGAIVVVILLNALIGFGTEWKAASALAGLRKRSVAVARVLRDGTESQIPAE